MVRLLLEVGALLLLGSVVLGTMSGFYYDSILDQQTVLRTNLDSSEQEVMQEEILHLLGLNTRPLGSNRRRTITPANSTVPTFMKDIYESLINHAGDQGEIKNLTFDNLDSLQDSQFQLQDKDLQAINESDIIMSFVNYGHQEDFEVTRRFWFDVSEVPVSDAILGCELRIYKKARGTSSTAYKVGVYQLMDGSTGEEDLLDSVVVRLDQEGWIVLDVGSALNFWLERPKHNLGLLLQVRSLDGKESLAPHDLGLVGDQLSLSPHESFMVAFLKDSSGRDISLSRERRSAREKRSPKPKDSKRSSSSGRRRQKQYSPLQQDFTYGAVYGKDYFDYYGGSSRRRGCQKRTLYVSFRDLGWEDWIIAPDGYAAFYCHGECSFPLNTHMNATNHAIVQTLVHLMKPYGGVPKPCCAPTKLSGISVLYFDESSNVILKKYQNMVVKSCGCH